MQASRLTEGVTVVAKKATLSVPDPALEERLHKRGVKFTYLSDIPTTAFDVDASMNNQARLTGELDEPTVVKYTEALKTHTALPAVIAHQNAAERLVMISGLHRLEAYTRTGLPLNVYLVVDASARTILELTFTENLPHGLPTSPDERERQALHLVENGMSSKEAAALLLVPHSRLERARAVQETRRRAMAAGINPRDWEKLPATTRTRLAGVHTDEGLTELGKLVIDAGLNADEVVGLIGEVNVSKSGTQQAALVRDLRDAYRDRIEKGGNAYNKTAGKKHTPRTTLERVVTNVLHLPEVGVIKDYYPGGQVEIVARLDDAIKALRAIKNGLSNGS
jgi:hypothetical protein